MKLAGPFVERRWWVAAGLTVLAGPLIGMFYLGRGRLAIIYGLGAVGLALGLVRAGIVFDLIGPDLDGVGLLATWPFRIAGAIHAVRIARATVAAVPGSWFARWYALIGIGLFIWGAFGLSAVAIRAFWFESFEMSSMLMAPLLREGDRVWVDKRAYNSAGPQIGDVVAIRDGDGIMLLRRIVARRDDILVTTTTAPGDRPLAFLPGAVMGKAVVAYWSGAASRWEWRRLD